MQVRLGCSLKENQRRNSTKLIAKLAYASDKFVRDK
jgi:hypothetical protein